ncbi:hypothetical protein T484DRAFT_1769018 [Baffinella frigidus]|nr:hypothetical protein T484DRAFT_1769018 [Cryptophyta sp. CCMP2293]
MGCSPSKGFKVRRSLSELLNSAYQTINTEAESGLGQVNGADGVSEPGQKEGATSEQGDAASTHRSSPDPGEVDASPKRRLDPGEDYGIDSLPLPLRSMYGEHCWSVESQGKFTSAYGIETTAHAEWDFVLGANGVDIVHWQAEWDFVGLLLLSSFFFTLEPEHTLRHELSALQSDRDLPSPLVRGRNAAHLADLLNRPERKLANLRDVEVIALRLMTGPMYQMYQEAARSPTAKHSAFYITRMVASSAILKLSRAAAHPLGTLYRGVRGPILPPGLDVMTPKTGEATLVEDATFVATTDRAMGATCVCSAHDSNPFGVVGAL